jgi:putative addiction module component (TIGR02574 family)
MTPSPSINELLALPAAERLRIVEAIWDSIAAEPDAIPLTEAQKREIESRLDEYRRDRGIAIPWDEARRRPQDGS